MRPVCDSQFYQSFNGFVGECFEGIAKFPVCWQFCWQLPPGHSQPPDAQASRLEPVVGFALHHCCVPTPTNSKQINPLRSFPSEIRLPDVFAKIKNYPATSASKFFHYPSSIILLELLLEVAPAFHRTPGWIASNGTSRMLSRFFPSPSNMESHRANQGNLDLRISLAGSVTLPDVIRRVDVYQNWWQSPARRPWKTG